MARVLAVEPYSGGSHLAFVEGLAARSRHEVRAITLPPRFWKWRMRGAAISMAEEARASGHDPEVIVASDMLSLPDFLSILGTSAPAILYMHESQLGYPVDHPDERDVHFGFTNVTSCLAARKVVWNSEFHMEAFLGALPGFVRQMPDYRPAWIAARIRERSVVIPLGVDLELIDSVPLERDGGPPVVVWNHRWEYDKRPEAFFDALAGAAGRGADFRVAILGESFAERPAAFDAARDRLGHRIVHMGWVGDRREYARWLRRASVSVSTAAQENFGISAVEAAYAGAHPLWPRRLSYPSLLPAGAGTDHLYDGPEALEWKLAGLVADAAAGKLDPGRWAPHLRRYGWAALMPRYDALIDEVADLSGGS